MNTSAHKRSVVYYKKKKIGDYISSENQSYVAIMTNKYTDDKLVFSKLIRRDFKFIGILGSVAKLDNMWDALLNEELTPEGLNKVFSLFGLPIKSKIPEEIAVSIGAQIVQIRNLK